MSDAHRILGLVLAGGKGFRLGAGVKALATLGGAPLAAHVAARLAPQCASLAVNANVDADRFAFLNAPVVADAIGGYLGPLAGVSAGFDYARANGFTMIATAPCDAPFLPLDFVAGLAACLGDADIAVARSGGRSHWTCALWRVSCADALRAALIDERARRMGETMARWRLAFRDWPDAPDDPFFNVNRPEDLAAAQDRLRDES